MIKQLKTQLHLRPSYDELLKQSLEGDENRSSIENVIDRKATRYRLKYGSQFDDKKRLRYSKETRTEPKRKI